MADELKAMSQANPNLGAQLQAGKAAADAAGVNWSALLQNLPQFVALVPQAVALLQQFMTLLKTPPQP